MLDFEFCIPSTSMVHLEIILKFRNEIEKKKSFEDGTRERERVFCILLGRTSF